MKCPVCQNEIKEGQLYCGECGYEIRIVPDFEAELENNIRETMSGVISDLTPDNENTDSIFPEDGAEERDTKEEWPEEDEWTEEGWAAEEKDPYGDDDERPSLLPFLYRFFRKHLVLLLILIVLIAGSIAVIVRGHILEARRNSYDYQYQMAVQAAAKGDYETALSYLTEALRIESDHPEARMLTADYKVKLGETKEAELLYQDLFAYEEYAAEAYEKYIALLEEEERYLDICNQLDNCEIPQVRTQYNHYLADPPIFSVQGGIYEDVQILKITANTNGIIYYTTDGTTPDESDNVYTGPIMLESGPYEISAVFINEYGMMSKVFSAQYQIEAELPNMPAVLPDGGDYQTPEYISVEVPQGCTVYYTTDGSEPDQSSLTYSREICMPLGNTTFRFVSYSSDHVASEITQVEYHLNLENPRFSEYQAMLITASGLTEQGILLNMEGEVNGASGTYSYKATAAFVYNDEVYYLMTEYYTDASGNTYSTQSRYAVSVAYGVLYKTNVDHSGHYTAIAFE